MCSDGTVYAGNDLGEICKMTPAGVEKIKVHRAGIKNLCLSSDERRLISMSYDRDLALISLEGSLRIETKVQIPDLVWARSCAFQGHDRLILGTFGSSYAALDLLTLDWDFSAIHGTDCINALLVTGEAIHTVGDSGQVRHADFAPVADSVRPLQVLAEMGSLCNFIVPYCDRMVTGGHLGKVFDAKTGEVLLTLKCPINKALQVREYLVLATYVGELAVCKFSPNGKLELVGEFKVLNNAIKDLCADDNFVFCGGAAADIAIFDIAEMRVIAQRQRAHKNIVNSCAALGQGRFVTVSRDLHMRIWNGLELELSLRAPHDHSIKCVAVSADKRHVASCSYDGKIAIFDRHSLTWPVYRRLTAAGISSVVYFEGAFWASSYDGQIPLPLVGRG